MTNNQSPTALGREPEVPNWTVMVLLSQQKRVRHLAVWGPTPWEGAGTLCRNRGNFPWYGRADEFPGVPLCTRCKAELDLMVAASRNIEDGSL